MQNPISYDKRVFFFLAALSSGAAFVISTHSGSTMLTQSGTVYVRDAANEHVFYPIRYVTTPSLSYTGGIDPNGFGSTEVLFTEQSPKSFTMFVTYVSKSGAPVHWVAQGMIDKSLDPRPYWRRLSFLDAFLLICAVISSLGATIVFRRERLKWPPRKAGKDG